MLILRSVCLALLAAALWGCSGSDGSKDQSSVHPGDAGVDQPPGAKKKPGEPCGGDAECASAVCLKGTCAKSCGSPADCDAGQECTSDDGKRVFCSTPSHAKAIGQSCAVTGSCPAGTTCLGGTTWAHAYCTADCANDAECPATHYCREYDAPKRRCVRRLFCTRCYHDGNCGAGKVCVEQGGERFCSRPCSIGTTECPRFAECKEVGGKPVCVHKAGRCDGDGKLCQPCHNTECPAPGFCLVNTFTAEQFCGQDCRSAGCPSSSYDCVGVGGTDKQCVPHYDPDLKQQRGCVSASPIGEKGDVIEDFATVGYADADKDGSLVGEKLQVLRLSDFATTAKIILFNLSAGWCKPCQAETQQSAALLKTFGPQGLAIFQVLFEGDSVSEPPTVALLDGWVSSLKAAGAVGIDVDAESIVYNTTGLTPVNMILDAKTLRVLDKFYAYNQLTLESKIKTHLGL